MFARDKLLWVDDCVQGRPCAGGCARGRGNGLRFVGLEDFEPAQLGVDERQGLEALGFQDLLVEPCFDLVLLFFR